MSESLGLPERKDVKAALRELGMSNRQVDALLRNGWKELVGESQAELAEAREILKALGKPAKRV